MTKVHLHFSEYLYQHLLNRQVAVDDFITQVLDALDNKGKPNLNTLTFNLRFNHAADGGSPEIADLKVSNAIYDEAKQTGRFKIHYRVERHYTCSDVKSQQKNTEVITFEIDTTAHILTLQIPEDESRDTIFEL
jgi:hypothetical protein